MITNLANMETGMMQGMSLGLWCVPLLSNCIE